MRMLKWILPIFLYVVVTTVGLLLLNTVTDFYFFHIHGLIWKFLAFLPGLNICLILLYLPGLAYTFTTQSKKEYWSMRVLLVVQIFQMIAIFLVHGVYIMFSTPLLINVCVYHIGLLVIAILGQLGIKKDSD